MNDQEIRDTIRQALKDWDAAGDRKQAQALARARRGTVRDRILGATIAQNGTVSYEGVSRGNKFTATTYQTADRFDWTRLPGDTKVIDLQGGDICTIWEALINHDHPSFGAKVEAARKAGFKIRRARNLWRCPVFTDRRVRFLPGTDGGCWAGLCGHSWRSEDE